MAGQVWAVNAEGGFMYSDNLSDDLRMALQPVLKLRQFADIKDEAHQGMHAGDTFHWNVYSDVGTQGGQLVETTTMPETSISITQGTLTITEYGNSVNYTGKLDDLSYHPVREIVTKALKNDAKKTFDTAVATQFDTTPLRVVPTSGNSTTSLDLTTNGVATETNNIAFQKEHARLVSITMKERNIPAFVADDYYAVGRPATFTTLRDNLESIRQYVETGFGMIMNGEVGRYEGIRFVEQTHIAVAGLGTAATTWTNGLSDWILFLGEDTVAEAIAVPEEIRGKLPGDFGRDKGVAWYYLGGFALTHPVAVDARCVIWDSAA